MNEWINEARSRLLKLRSRRGVWGYQTDRGPSTEATALACLGLWSCWQDAPPADEAAAVRRGADWLVSVQREDGSLGVSPSLPTPGWATPYAMLLWSALEIHPQARRRAADWLLREKGQSVPADQQATYRVVGHDPTLVGWPWIEGTHSWLEPTAMAILALRREGMSRHPRVVEGLMVLTDRAVAGGGWNYGNKSVFGRDLRPQPGPTGLALAALAGHEGGRRPRAVDPAIAYLKRVLPDVAAPLSLGWGVLGLRAWNACPPQAASWLSQSCEQHIKRTDVTAGLGLLLMAGGDNFARPALALAGRRGLQPSPPLFGLSQPDLPGDARP